MISKLQQRGVLLQHAGYLHLNLVSQRLALGQEERPGEESGQKICRGSRDGGATDHAHLIVYLQLLQRGVVLQRLNQGQDSRPRDEVGLHVQALQRRVHSQHLRHCLEKHQTL